MTTKWEDHWQRWMSYQWGLDSYGDDNDSILSDNDIRDCAVDIVNAWRILKGMGMYTAGMCDLLEMKFYTPLLARAKERDFKIVTLLPPEEAEAQE